ncbi:MAG: trigger factor [Candidatus Eremiobacteraeota bacterium]|nr:trigger factor [Candidatus Eremiobacteraeota bacterium]
MPSTLKPLDATQIELEISISPEEFQAAQDAAFRKLVRKVRVPGFRPGKVPRKIYESQYGTSQIFEGALDDLVPKKYAAAIDEHGIEPLAQPQMELLPEAEGQPLRVKAVVPVRPAFEPQGYAGIEVPELPETATDTDVERMLERLRDSAATLIPVERPIRLGDIATLEYVGTVDGVPFDGGQAVSEETEVEEDALVPGFAQGLIGTSAGETKEIPVTFPEAYPPKPELAGKEAVFTVTVHEVKEREMPSLDADFAARVLGKDGATLDELRADVKRRLDEGAKARARRAMSDAILQAIVAANDIPLPQVLIDRETQSLLDEARQQAEREGVDWQEFLERGGITEEALQTQVRSEAERRVKTALVVEAIARKEGIHATQADIEAELDALAAQYRQPRERIVEALRPNVPALVDGIVRTKTIDRLIEQARRVPATEAEAT